jgi:hypothetical protein
VTNLPRKVEKPKENDVLTNGILPTRLYPVRRVIAAASTATLPFSLVPQVHFPHIKSGTTANWGMYTVLIWFNPTLFAL